MILVTGASGHLGANLVRRLLDDGQAVRVLVRPERDGGALNGLDVDHREGDLRDLAACAQAVHGCPAVYHCAAKVSTVFGNRRHRQEIFESNVLGTRNLLQAARAAGVERVVVTGSLSAVGHEPGRPSDESMPFNPFDRPTPYASSKAAVEHECLKAFAEGLPVVIATSCAILGPNDFKPSRMGQLLLDFANGRLRAYVPGGFEFVAARDIVQGHVLAMARGRPGQRYIFCTQSMSVEELFTIYEDVTGRPRPRLRLPGPVMAGLAALSDFFMNRLAPNAPRRFSSPAVRFLRMHRRADCGKAKRELGYEPTSIREAILEAYEFFLARGMIVNNCEGTARTGLAGSRRQDPAGANRPAAYAPREQENVPTPS
jgi:nucleoside-diphosphate-sugar epimerase